MLSGVLSRVNGIDVDLPLHMERLCHLTVLSFNPMLCVHDDILWKSLWCDALLGVMRLKSSVKGVVITICPFREYS